MSREGFFEFLTFGLLDLVGALILGYELGTFSGIVPARRK
jgi:ABC-type cobalt transport system substrate-binding protein